MPADVCLTFDDHFVDNWLAARPLLQEHRAKVTFCICNLHGLTAKQIDGLHRLQGDGHEIAFHSRTHPRLKPYLQRHGLDAWLSDEIDRGVDEHRAAGFPATAFASPFHASTPETRSATKRRFRVTRAKGPRGVTRENLSTRLYKTPTKIVHNVGSVDFRHPAQRGWPWLEEILDAIRAHEAVGVFTGHDIRPADQGEGFYMTLDDLDRLLEEISRRRLGFRTLSGMNTIAASTAHD